MTLKLCKNCLELLKKNFTYVVVSTEESREIETMSVEELESTLTLHEQKFNMVKREENDQVLQVEKNYGSRPSRGRGDYRGRMRGGKSKSSFNKAAVECFKCHNLGHFQNECPRWKNKEAHYVEIEDEDDLILTTDVEDGIARKLTHGT